jgi:transcriptional regulator with XRE-family HTH domain
MPYRFCPAEQEAAGCRFGAMLRRWRQLNGWTQYTVNSWAKQAGFDAVAPSTLSVMENGKAFKPRPETFFALGEANRRIDAGDFTGVTDRALLELLQQGKALVGDDAVVWGPAEFWSCHVGLLPVPQLYAEAYLPVEQVSDQEAAALSEHLATAFRQAAQEAGAGPIAALRAASRRVPPKHRGRFQSVASGLSVFSGAEVLQLGGPKVLGDWIRQLVGGL